MMGKNRPMFFEESRRMLEAGKTEAVGHPEAASEDDRRFPPL